MKTHDDIRRKLSEYLDESLPLGERETIERHLEECPECSADLVALRKTVEHVRSLDKVEPPPWLTGKIMARVREEAPARKGFLAWLFFPLHIKIPLEALAVLLICFGGYFLANRTSKEEPALLPGPPPVLQAPAPPTEVPELKQEKVPTTSRPETSVQRETEKAQKGRVAEESQASPPPPSAFAPPPPPPTATSTPRPARQGPPGLPTETTKPWLEPLPEVPHSLKSKQAMPQAKKAERPVLIQEVPQNGAKAEADVAEKAAKAVIREALYVLQVLDPIQTVAAVEDIVEKEKGRVLQVEMEGTEVVIHVLSSIGGKDRIIAGLRSLGPIEEESAAADEGRRFVIRIEKRK